MSEPYDLIVRGGTVVAPEGIGPADVAVRGSRIAAIGSFPGTGAREILDARGLHVLPGVIDPHVHFREPGGEHKEEIETGSRAAVLGGVTAIFEMPNTNPPTTTPDALGDKLSRAAERAWCDHAFFLGATVENVDSLGEWERSPGCCGVKVFAGSSTGTLLLEKESDLRRLFARVRRRVAIHSEDEERLRERRPLAGSDPANHPVWRDPETAARATARILRLAREANRSVHFPHVSTAEEVPLLAEARPLATMEVTPQHLLLEAPDCYRRLGTRAQMNPPIREARHRRELWRAVVE
ncbi:MAG: amidohydrolase family protein, partial [Candidatus Eisenbacteria bacterium]|nr:amidohydrolase family protein [Candidatus Latescibacterota bacterium]MBD3303235.1 amidohydrolase family protein [Candidatus Eisenbacteria bacterium]